MDVHIKAETFMGKDESDTADCGGLKSYLFPIFHSVIKTYWIMFLNMSHSPSTASILTKSENCRKAVLDMTQVATLICNSYSASTSDVYANNEGQ